jgi:hypothetical protein
MIKSYYAKQEWFLKAYYAKQEWFLRKTLADANIQAIEKLTC